MHRCLLRVPFALFAMSCALAAEAPIPATFPLESGFVWIYRGRVKWTEDGNALREKELQWRVRILESRHRKTQVIARLEGWLDDLAWYEPGKRPGAYVLVSDPRRGLHIFAPPTAEAFWARHGASLREPIPEAELGKAERLLPASLSKDMTWSEGEGLTEGDSPGLHRIEEVGTQGLGGLGGWTGARRAPYFRIASRTNTDHSLMDFVPGLGFTRYTYVHHGSTSECDMTLVAVEGRARVRTLGEKPRR